MDSQIQSDIKDIKILGVSLSKISPKLFDKLLKLKEDFNLIWDKNIINLEEIIKEGKESKYDNKIFTVLSTIDFYNKKTSKDVIVNPFDKIILTYLKLLSLTIDSEENTGLIEFNIKLGNSIYLLYRSLLFQHDNPDKYKTISLWSKNNNKLIEVDDEFLSFLGGINMYYYKIQKRLKNALKLFRVYYKM